MAREGLVGFLLFVVGRSKEAASAAEPAAAIPSPMGQPGAPG